MPIVNRSSQEHFETLAEAVAAAVPHDEIQLTRTIETTVPIIIDRPLSLVGMGNMPAIVLRGLLPARTGIVTTRADTTIRNIEVRGARSISGNGAGVWQDGAALRLDSCTFMENQNGVMGAGGADDAVAISRCSFILNGGGCGHTHGIYAGRIGSLVVSRSLFEDTLIGHHVKSRARETRVEYCHFTCTRHGSTSCEVDIPDRGIGVITRNLMIKGTSSKSAKFISYGAERQTHIENRLSVNSNIFINHRGGASVAVANYALSVPAELLENAFERVTLPLLGRGRARRRRNVHAAIRDGA